MLATLNFYNENVIISLPKTFYEFKLIIVEKYMIGIDDLNKLIFLCENKEISNEEQYQKIISLNKRITIFIQVSEKSKIHNTEEKYSIKKIEEKEKLEDKKEENIIENIINTKIGNIKEKLEDEKKENIVENIINTKIGNIKEKLEDEKEENIIENIINTKIGNIKEKLEDEKKENIVENIINTKIGNIKEKLENEKEEVIHKNVRCDGCKKYPITGIRYKCTICHNFHYCEDCEKKFNKEHNHPFLKIRKPELAHFAYEYMRKQSFKY